MARIRAGYETQRRRRRRELQGRARDPGRDGADRARALADVPAAGEAREPGAAAAGRSGQDRDERAGAELPELVSSEPPPSPSSAPARRPCSRATAGWRRTRDWRGSRSSTPCGSWPSAGLPKFDAEAGAAPSAPAVSEEVTRTRSALFGLPLVLLPALAAAQMGAAPPPRPATPGVLQEVGFDQHLGESVPLDLAFTDETGRSVKLGDYFGKKPVVLSLVYYDCPMLCTLSLNGLAGALEVLSVRAGAGVRGPDGQLRLPGDAGARGRQEEGQYGALPAAGAQPAGTS